MTPVAHAIAKQAMLKPRKRKPVRSADTRELLSPEEVVSDIHCFECTEVIDLAFDLSDSGRVWGLSQERFFLPSPKTWIEHKDADGRHAILLHENPFRCQFILESDDRFLVKTIDLTEDGEDGERGRALTGLVFGLLAIINTPQIVCRDEYQPNRGLMRLWMKRFRKHPLHAWHELKLRVNKPIEIDDDEPHAAQIGGQRALHFCRAHLRIRLGRLEFVTSHWRGDPSLGTKLTRYRVEH